MKTSPILIPFLFFFFIGYFLSSTMAQEKGNKLNNQQIHRTDKIYILENKKIDLIGNERGSKKEYLNYKPTKETSLTHGSEKYIKNISNQLNHSNLSTQSFVIDTVIVLSLYDSTKCFYEYNLNGKMTSELRKKLSNYQWENYWRDTYTYDENENMLSELFEFWQSGQWLNSERTTYTYDVDGKTQKSRNGQD